MHKEILWTVLEDKKSWTKEDRCSVIATFRGAAKTSWLSLAVPAYYATVGRYGIVVGNYELPRIDYIILKSKTGKSASKNLFNLYRAFGSKEFVDLFGNLTPTIKQVRDKQGKSSSNILIFKDTEVIIEALGIDQQIRGTNFFGKRPKLVIYDDPETRENTKTEDRRRNNKMDLLDETWGAIDDYVGRIIYIGNMVHTDCLLASLLKTKGWRKRFYQITYNDKGDLDEFGKPKVKPTWERRFPMSLIEKKKEYYLHHKELGEIAWYQNFYNIVKTSVHPLLRRAKITYIYKNRVNFLKVEEEDKQPKIVNVWITIGLDKAQTMVEHGSQTSILVLGQDSDGNKYVIANIVGRFDQRERYNSEGQRPRSGIYLNEKDVVLNVQRRGSAEEVIRQIYKYNADGFGMGVESQQEGTYNDILDLLRLTNYSRGISTFGYRSTTDKTKRNYDGVIRQYEAGVVVHNAGLSDLDHEVETFPYNKMDCLDSFFYADTVQYKPNFLEYTEESREYEEKSPIPEIQAEESWMIA